MVDWLCEGKEERDEGHAKDDLRARPEFFNFRFWLDESASEWVPPAHRFLQDPGGNLRVAGAMRGPSLTRGVSPQNSHPPAEPALLQEKRKNCWRSVKFGRENV